MAFNLSALTAQQQAAAIYIGYYDRAPDPYGMDFWEAAVRNPLVSLVEIATYFSAQEETYAVHPFFVTPSASAANVFISELYLNLFNRSPDMAGLTFWSGVLQQSIDGTGPLSVGEIILAIIEGAQNSAEGQDITTLLNKIEVANAWTDGAEAAGLTAPNSYGDSEIAQASAKSIINDVTFASSSVDTAKAEITSTFENFVDGSKFTLTADAPSILEGDNGTKVLVFKATLDEAPNQAISVNYETLSSGTAASGDDFTAVAGAVTFAPGQTVATVSVTVLGDATFEADETIEVKFSGARLTGDVTATGTITNDDIDPQVALGAAYTAAKATYDAAVAAAATSSAAATAAQTAADLAETAVNSLATANAYSTAAQAAQTAAVAAQADAAAVVTAAAAVQAAAAATLSIADDADVAGVSATALAAKAAADTVKSVADAEVANAVAQIANYTGQTYTLSTSSPSITEGDTGTKNLTFTLTLDEAPTKAITINYQTLNSGTATAGDDFNVAAGSVEFAAGQTVATVSVIINADTDFEGDETVQVQFSGDALDAAVTATGTITENDVDPDTVSQTFTLTTGSDVLTPSVAAVANRTSTGNDSIFGLTSGSLSSADIIDGGAGTDALIADYNLAADNATTTVSPFLSNVESLTIRNSGVTADGGETLVYNASQTTGLTSLTFDDFTGNTAALTATASNLSIDVAMLGVSNNDVSNHAYNFNYSAATGTADAVTLNLANNATATGIVTISDATATATADTGFETVTINITGGTSTITDVVVSDAGGDSVNTFKFTGDKSLTIINSLGFEGTTAGTIDASGFTAGTLTISATDGEAITFTGGAGDVSLTTGVGNDKLTGGLGNETFIVGTGDDVVVGGAGDDVLVIANAALTNADSITLGVGTRDEIRFTDVTQISATGVINDSLLAGFADVEVIGSSAAVTSVDANAFTQNIFNLSGNLTAAVTVSDAGTGDIVVLSGAGIDLGTGNTAGDALTLSGALPGQSVTLELSDADILGDDGNDGDTAITVASAISTVNIVSTKSGTAAVTNTISVDGAGGVAATADHVIDNVSAQNFVVSGDQALTISSGELAGFSNAVNFDASAATGVINVVGSAVADIIKGGSAADVIDGEAGNDVLTGGGGADTFVFLSTESGTPSATSFEQITDFNTGGSDIIDWDASLTIEVAATAAVAGTAQVNAEGVAIFNAADDTLAEKLAAVVATVNSDGDFVIFQHANDSFVFISGDANSSLDAADSLIQLVGVTGLTDSTITGGGDLTIA